MAEFKIRDEELDGWKDKVAVITGAASGIGLATATLFASKGAYVITADVNEPKDKLPGAIFVKADVTEWDQLVALFKTALEKHGRVDVVFANAGIGVSDTCLSLPTSPNGDPLPPSHRTISINLLSCINTALLGIHYMKAQPHGGSIICTASVSSYVRFAGSDYATAKHGVLGFMRSLHSQVGPNASVEGESNVKVIRINAVAPSWTSTGLVPTALIESVGVKVQGPDVVARSAALLAVDERRHGECIYSADGQFKEVDKMVLTKTDDVLGENTESGAGGVMERLREMRKRAAAGTS